MQHERDPLRRDKAVEHHEQRQSDLVGQRDDLVRVGPLAGDAGGCLRPRPERLLPAYCAGPQQVQA
jgi:hypothetical protein